MSFEFVNKICPYCKNANYMVLLGDLSKVYKYKCMNCNGYFNDIDFEEEPLQPVQKSECRNTKVDMVEVVRCKDCIYADSFDCPAPLPPGYLCHKGHGRHMCHWFCADGEERQEERMNEKQIDMLKKALALYEFAIDQIAEFDERNEFFCMVEELSKIVGIDLH